MGIQTLGKKEGHATVGSTEVTVDHVDHVHLTLRDDTRHVVKVVGTPKTGNFCLFWETRLLCGALELYHEIMLRETGH
jgi:hypothetical protein